MFNVSELDEFYEEDMMISNTTVVPHVEKWETVKCSFVVKKSPTISYSWQSVMTSTKRLQGILVLKIIDHLTMAFFTAGKINLDSGCRLYL